MKKETKQEKRERIRLAAENHPIVLELREHVRRGKEELARRRVAEGRGDEPIVVDIHEVARRGREELARRRADEAGQPAP